MNNNQLFNLIIQIQRANQLKDAGYPVSYDVVYNPNHPFSKNINQIDVVFTVGEKTYTCSYFQDQLMYNSYEEVSLSSALHAMENKLIVDIKNRQLVESVKSKLTEEELAALKVELVK